MHQDFLTRAKRLNLVVDTYGCPNRCLHCWLGHMPNRRMEDGADEFIVSYFSPYFDEIAYYSWLREPDFCDGYKARWERDIAVSKNAVPQRFELASFFRIVRDEAYIPFLKSVGVKKVQLTFFGLKETQDRYVGRKGAYEEVMHASDLLIENGVLPRWQCFINEENKSEIVRLYEIARELRQSRCPELEFFVHEGTCDGENRKLYPIRIRKSGISDELIPVFLDYGELLTESQCCASLLDDHTSPHFPVGEEITLNISNRYDVFYNFTHMTEPWKAGNLKTDAAEELVRRLVTGDTPALNAAKKCTWAELARRYGDGASERAFSLDDYKMYLFNRYLEEGGAVTVTLGDRTPETVAEFFEKSQQPFIRAMLPQKAQSVEEALEDYRQTLLPTATSYGRTVLADGKYVGDVWCYGIDRTQEPNAMLSFCIFDAAYRSKGVGTKAASLFLAETAARYGLETVGAFTFSDNAASCRVLEKNGFCLIEEFTENGRRSKYYQKNLAKGEDAADEC